MKTVIRPVPLMPMKFSKSVGLEAYYRGSDGCGDWKVSGVDDRDGSATAWHIYSGDRL
jgi:hypothetical protein